MSEYNFENWEVIIDDPDLIVESNGGRICKMALDKDIKKVAARADLIAAAPELLEAAEEIAEELNAYPKLIEKLEKAIKKAKGDDE